MSKIGLIIEREYLTRVNKKSFILMTILLPLIFVGIILIPAFLSQVKDSDIKTIAIIDNTELYGDVLKSNDEFNFVYVPEIGLNQSNENVIRDNYAVVVIDKNLIENHDAITIFSDKIIPPALKTEISQQFNPWLSEKKMEYYNIPNLKNIIEDSSVRININTIKWGENGSEVNSSGELASLIGLMTTIVIYMFIFAFGSMVMTSVIQEKTNRIVEIMVSSVKPFELMMGKIIAVAFVGLTQFLIWILLIAGILGSILFVTGMASDPENISEIGKAMVSQNPGMNQMGELMVTNPVAGEIQSILASVNFVQIAIMFIFYFIGGYFLYASLFAAIGSLVDQDTDTQQFMLPVTMINIFALYVGIYSASNPDGPLAFWCSMIPFTSPVVMMVRLPYDVPYWELALSVGILYCTSLMTIKFASKIYRTGILMYGKKITYKEVFKWFRYKY